VSSKRFRTVILLVVLAVVALLAFRIPANRSQAPIRASVPENQEPVARLGEQTISSAELDAAVRNQLKQIELQAYELKRRALEDIIANKLIQAEAAQQKVSPEELIRSNADSKVSSVTDSEVKAFYQARADRINKPLNEVRSQIEQAVQQAKIQQARENYVATLRAKTPAVVLLRPPQIGVIAEGSRVKGRADAPITIVEFSDFQCPFCRNASATVRQIAAKYGNDVRLAFRDLPLRQLHPNAQRAAEASRCAADQGKFWEYHDVLFANQDKLDRDGLLLHARTMGLDMHAFSACLDQGKYTDAVEKDVQEAQAAGVSGTPAFFINGVLLKGDVPASAFQKVIEEELAYIRYQQSCNQECVVGP
jgi:protein-disulfide isomerase